jgi:hypothetical protein
MNKAKEHSMQELVKSIPLYHVIDDVEQQDQVNA